MVQCKSLAFPRRVKDGIPRNPEFYSLVCTPEKIERRCSNKNVDLSVHSSTIHNCQKIETIPMYINRWEDKQNVAHPYNSILSAIERYEILAWSTTWADPEGIMLSERSERTQTPKTIYLMIWLTIGKPAETESRWVVARAWREWETGNDC